MLVLLTTFAAAVQAPATGAVATDIDPIICTKQNVGDEVGTHMRTRKKLCLRKSDRDFIDKHEKEAIQHLVNDGNGRMATPPDPPKPPR